MSIGNNVGMNQNFLSDYASIKNGSYARLMKSYYGTGQTLGSVPSSSKKSTKTSNVLDKILEERKNQIGKHYFCSQFVHILCKKPNKNCK